LEFFSEIRGVVSVWISEFNRGVAIDCLAPVIEDRPSRFVFDFVIGAVAFLVIFGQSKDSVDRFASEPSDIFDR